MSKLRAREESSTFPKIKEPPHHTYFICKTAMRLICFVLALCTGTILPSFGTSKRRTPPLPPLLLHQLPTRPRRRRTTTSEASTPPTLRFVPSSGLQSQGYLRPYVLEYSQYWVHWCLYLVWSLLCHLRRVRCGNRGTLVPRKYWFEQ